MRLGEWETSSQKMLQAQLATGHPASLLPGGLLVESNDAGTGG